MVDARDLKSLDLGDTGSIPVVRTITYINWMISSVASIVVTMLVTMALFSALSTPPNLSRDTRPVALASRADIDGPGRRHASFRRRASNELQRLGPKHAATIRDLVSRRSSTTLAACQITALGPTRSAISRSVRKTGALGIEREALPRPVAAFGRPTLHHGDWRSWIYLTKSENELLRPLPGGSPRVETVREGRDRSLPLMGPFRTPSPISTSLT